MTPRRQQHTVNPQLPEVAAERPGDPFQPSVITATSARKHFGRLISEDIEHRDIIITRRGVPTAVAMSVERYRSLSTLDAIWKRGVMGNPDSS